MPLHPNVRRCTHIQITGHRCGSPALKQEYFCYFHTRMIKGVQTRVDSQIHPVALIESAEAIQAAIMHTIDAVLKGTLDNKRANLVLKALYIAVRNSRNVYFHIRRDDMVREVPNYAEQYLSEHPELNSPEPNPHVAPDAVGGAEPKSAETNPVPKPESAANKKAGHAEPARQRESKAPESVNSGNGVTGNSPHPREGNRHEIRPGKEALGREHRQGDTRRPETHEQETPKKAGHPEQARRRESKDPHSANSRNAVPGNSPHPPEGNGKKTWGENVSPLTTRQSKRWDEIKKLEASIEGATRGNWRDLRKVFNAVGLTPRKPPCKDRVSASVLARAPVRK